MSSIKTGLVVVMLLAVGCGVYIMLNKTPGSAIPPPMTANAWGPPQVELTTGQPPLPTVALGGPEVSVGSESTFTAPGASVPSAPQHPTTVAPAAAWEHQHAAPPTDIASSTTGPPPAFDDPATEASVYSQGNPTPTLDTTSAAPQDPYSGQSAAEIGPIDSDRFASAWRAASKQLEQNQLPGALLTLSTAYGSPELTSDEARRMSELMDQLAGTVIYSRQHTLEAAYTVRGGESLSDIAAQYTVPWQLLANINGIDDPRSVLPGTELKVVRGPFRADVSLQRGELTMYLGKYYAGRFPITVGNDPAPREGTYEVLQKREGAQDYFAPDGRVIAAGDADNPYGNHWIGLTSSLSIHGSPGSYRVDTRGCISLSPVDARDVFAILSENSRISIKR